MPRKATLGRKKIRINVTLTDDYASMYDEIKNYIESETGISEDAGIVRALVKTYYNLKLQAGKIEEIK